MQFALFTFNMGNSQGFRNGQIAALENVRSGEVYLSGDEWRRKEHLSEKTEPKEGVSPVEQLD